jgi:phosphatidylethanolamine-binding protein (PEBP) family uncharacterized protein
VRAAHGRLVSPSRAAAFLVFLLTALLAPTACGAVGATDSADSGATATTTSAANAAVTAATTATSLPFTLSSPAVADGRLLPEYKCERKVDGVEESIPLTWANVPASARSLAVVMYHYPDPDDHTKVSSYLLLWGVDPTVTLIPHGGADDGAWYVGANKDGTAISYTSPCSKGPGTHEYTITVYALSEMPPSLPRESSLAVTYDVLMEAIDTVAVIGTASLTFLRSTP